MHVFVAMPFGTKEEIDFNRIYSELIKPALEQEGFEVFRADEEQRAAEIRTDMFQELLLDSLLVVIIKVSYKVIHGMYNDDESEVRKVYDSDPIPGERAKEYCSAHCR